MPIFTIIGLFPFISIPMLWCTPWIQPVEPTLHIGWKPVIEDTPLSISRTVPPRIRRSSHVQQPARLTPWTAMHRHSMALHTNLFIYFFIHMFLYVRHFMNYVFYVVVIDLQILTEIFYVYMFHGFCSPFLHMHGHFIACYNI